MVEYFRLKDSLPAYTAGQRTGDRLRQRRSLADFAKALQTGDYNAASGSLAQMGDVQGAMNVRRIPATDEADKLGNEYTQTRIDDVGIDNRRADRTFAANQAQRQYANARAEAEFRLRQAKANSTLGKLKMDLDAGYITKEQFDAAVEKATDIGGPGAKITAAQSDYQTAVQQGFGGTFMDFQKEVNQAKKGLTAGDRKAVIEANEAAYAGTNVINSLEKALELNDEALSGFGAKSRAYAGSLFGHDASESALMLDNIVTSQALENLKATFGGMPTEGERQILLEVQGSINQPPAIRKQIFERAMLAAKRRIQFNNQQAEGIRSGDIYQPGYTQTGISDMTDAELEAIANGGQ